MDNPLDSHAASNAAILQSKHVVMVMEENQSYSTVVGHTSVWPNLNALIDKELSPHIIIRIRIPRSEITSC